MPSSPGEMYSLPFLFTPEFRRGLLSAGVMAAVQIA